MRFTKTQVDALVAVLPGCADAHRPSLLRRIFEEWSRIDLEEHLTRSTPKQIQAKRLQIENIATRASQLAQALSKVEGNGRFVIAGRLLKTDASALSWLGHEDRSEADRRLSEIQKRLEELAKAATKASNAFVPLPHRHNTVVRYLVLLDLAAVFEWATRQRASRKVGTDAGTRPGQTYGPFWDFASAAWPIIFGSSAGLDNALKFWAEGRRLYDEASPIMWNLHMRHPQWRIFEVDHLRTAIRKG
jgi:hypothetical protein